MIGHYLLSLSPEQENRVLTQIFQPAVSRDGCRCLVMTAENRSYWRETRHAAEAFVRRSNSGPHVPDYVYERLCERFGIERVNAAIRTRILTNRLWRAKLAPAAQREAEVIRG